MLRITQLSHYSQLMRLHRPVGILLVLWPALIALWLAGEGSPHIWLVIAFTLGAIIMRSAGCVINDFADQHIDGYVQRTKERPLVSGKVTPQEAIALFLLLNFLAFALVCTLNFFTIILSLGGVLLAFCYPFMKRHTHFPQVFLGAAFGWAVPMAYAAQSQDLPWDCWLLFLATLVWAVAYDTLYAMVDREDDRRIGVKSMAIWFGENDKAGVACAHFMMLALYLLIGKILHLGFFYFLGMAVALGLVFYQQWLIRDRDPAKCFKAFLNNQWLGAALFFGTVLDSFF